MTEIFLTNEEEMVVNLIEGGMNESQAINTIKELNNMINLGLNNTITKIDEYTYITNKNNSIYYKNIYGFQFAKITISNI